MKTRDELHIAFKIELDKCGQSVAFGGAPAFLELEIDYWINKALIEAVITKFTGNNFVKIPFEQSVKRISDLENLIVERDNLNTSLESENQLETVLPKDFMLFVSGQLFFVSKNGEGLFASIVLTDHNKAHIFRKTYNNNPYIENPISIIRGNELHTFIDVHTMKDDKSLYTMFLLYVKTPTKLEDYPEEGLNEIPDYMWSEIIGRATLLALEDIESLRYQSKAQLNNISE